MSDQPNTGTNTDPQTTADIDAILAGMRLPRQLQPSYRAELPPQLRTNAQLPPELQGTVVPPGTFTLRSDPANPTPSTTTETSPPPATTPTPSVTPGGDQPLASPPTAAQPGSVVPGSNAPMLRPTPPIPALTPPTGAPGGAPGQQPVPLQPSPQQQQQRASETQQKFIQTYGPLAEEAGKQLGVDPRLILGQWALESGWGAGPGAAQVGNMAGIKGRDGQYTRYNSPEEFADAYVRFLRDNPRYRNAIGAGGNADRFFGALKQAGYFGADLGQYTQGVFRNIGIFGTVAQGQGPTVQPQQSYPPAQPRDAEDWGHPPPIQGGRGPNGEPGPEGLPQPSAFGRIMSGLAPLLVAIGSLALRLPLSSAITAYGAVAKAQAAGEEQDYQRQSTYWRTKLGEATAQQALESRAASDAFSTYGHNNPQGLQQELMRVALRYNDPAMYRMAEQGDLNGIYQMQQRRDALNQDLTKTHRAAEQEADRQAEDNAVKAMDNQWHDQFVKDNGREPTADETAIAHNEHIGQAGRAGTKDPRSAGTGEEAPVYNVIDKGTGKVTRQVRVGRNGGAFDLNGQPTTIDPAKEELQPVARPAQVKPTPTNPYVQPDQQQPGDVTVPSGPDQQEQQQEQQAPSDQGDQGAASQAPAGPVQTAAAAPAAPAPQAEQPAFAPYQVAQAGSGIQPPPSTAQPAQPQERAAPGMGPRMSRLTPEGRRLARDYAMNGNEALQDVDKSVRQPLIDAGQELRSQMEEAAQSGLTGKNLDRRLHQIDPTFADYLKGVSDYTNDLPTPGRTGSTGGRIMALSIAHALNPNFSEQNLKAQQDFRRPGSFTQRTLSRAAVMAESARQVREYLKALPADPGLQRWQRAWDQFVNNKLVGDHRYSDLFIALRQYIQEANVLVRGGQESVTETGEQLGTREGGGLFGGAAFAMPGNATPGMILGLLKTDARNTIARMDNYRNQWRQQDGHGEMPGDDAGAYRTFQELGDMDVDKEAGVASDSDIEKFLGR